MNGKGGKAGEKLEGSQKGKRLWQSQAKAAGSVECDFDFWPGCSGGAWSGGWDLPWSNDFIFRRILVHFQQCHAWPRWLCFHFPALACFVLFLILRTPLSLKWQPQRARKSIQSFPFLLRLSPNRTLAKNIYRKFL